MSETNATFAADEPFFKSLLVPHRSLGRTGFMVLMGALAVGWLATGAIFLSQGAWPIFGFLGLDVIGLYIAFRLNYRAGRAREEVSISRTSVDILKTAPSGRSERFHFNPFWARFAVSRHDEIGITGMAVVSREQNVPIGSFLNPDDRESFATAFSRALATARSG